MIEIDIETASGSSLNEIREVQKRIKRILPSDYVYLLMNYNELTFANDKLGVIFDGDEEVGILEIPLFNLPLFADVNHNRSEEAKDFYRYNENDYLAIGTLMNNGALLIGCKNDNVNTIFVDIPLHTEGVIKVADNYFELLNDVIQLQ